MLIVGWVGVSGTPYTAKQLPYLASNGLGGLFLLGAAAMLWLSADLRDEWRKLDRIELAIREHGTAGLGSDAVLPDRATRTALGTTDPAASNVSRRAVAVGRRS
jgi:hypothetical protein